MAAGPPQDGLDTFPKLVQRHAVTRGSKIAMRHKDLGLWQSWSWAELAEAVRAYAAGLALIGVKRGDAVAIIGSNRPRLYWSFLAAQALGAVPVPVYADSVADELGYVLDDAGCVVAVAEDQEQVDKILSISERVPQLRHMLYDEPRGLIDYDHAQMTPISDAIAAGRQRLAADPQFAAGIDAAIAGGKGDDISVILYTSGTTGRPKGVMLAAGRAIAAAASTVAFDKLGDEDVALSYLPLAWVGDHYLNFAQAMVAGFCIACPESGETVQQDLKEIGPSFYFAPPRVFENLLTRITIRMQDAGALQRFLFKTFMGLARRHGEAILDGKKVPLPARLAYGLGEALVYGPLKNALGYSKVRIAYTAGEAIGPELFSFYRSLGLNLKQLYGQTEAFLYVTCQADGAITADAVGPAAPNVDIRIAESGEVQFRSPGMFVSYHKLPEKTAEAMTPDGYVKTGDAGFFDAAGQLKIIDRAKDVGRLTTGALFAPKYIENKLKFFPNIKEAVAFGDGCAFVACMLNIDLAAVGAWAERNNVVYGSYKELAAHPQVYDMLAGDVAEVNRMLAQEPKMAQAQITRFLILPKELDADDGELTRTQKVRRSFIAERYAPLVEALYDGSRDAEIAIEVAFEDGRKGEISGHVAIRDALTAKLPAEQPTQEKAA
ncbi:long-chain acyl-CoA synthetase [Rhizobiales bacterium GAS113]|nr:long-chain acyl-CoA synthetase [Rhizobiales bacterium GAS113]